MVAARWVSDLQLRLTHFSLSLCGHCICAQVAGNQFIFGAFMHCSWAAARGAVSDPTGKSFLFSLANGSGKEVRFTLRDKDHAVHVGNGGVCFGRPESPNFVLMRGGKAADQLDGIRAYAALRGEAALAYQPDGAGRMKFDEKFLAGSRCFAAEEIEVLSFCRLR